MSTRLLSLSVFCLLTLSLSGQNDNRLNDEIRFADGTTARVDLRRSTPLELSQAIVLRRGADRAEEKFGPIDVASFRFARTQREYRSVTVELPDAKRGGETVAQRRFGEVLASGDVELIKVALTVKEYDSQAADSQPYLYLLREGEVELVLELTSILIYDRLHANPSRFRNMLKFLVRDCPDAYKLARRARFYDSDILRVLSTYGACTSAENLKIDDSRLRGSLRLHHYARVFHLGIRDAEFNNDQFSLGIGYQAEARFDSRFRRLSVLASLDYVYHSYRWQDVSDVAQSMVRGNFSLGFAPILQEDFRVNVTAGLSTYNAFSSSFNSFFSNNYFLLNGGVYINRKNFLFGLHYEHLPGQIQRRPSDILLTTLGYRVRF